MKTTPYDVAEHLRAPEDRAAYRDAWLEKAPDDAAGIAEAIGNIERAEACAARRTSKSPGHSD